MVQAGQLGSARVALHQQAGRTERARGARSQTASSPVVAPGKMSAPGPEQSRGAARRARSRPRPLLRGGAPSGLRARPRSGPGTDCPFLAQRWPWPINAVQRGTEFQSRHGGGSGQRIAPGTRRTSAHLQACRRGVSFSDFKSSERWRLEILGGGLLLDASSACRICIDPGASAAVAPERALVIECARARLRPISNCEGSLRTCAVTH